MCVWCACWGDAVQGVDPHKRETRRHVLFDSQTWVPAFNLSLITASALCDLVEHVGPLDAAPAPGSATLDAFHSAVREMAAVMSRWSLEREEGKQEVWPEKVRARGCEARRSSLGPAAHARVRGVAAAPRRQLTTCELGRFNLVDYDVAKLPVSFHAPLHRLFGTLSARLAVAAGVDVGALLRSDGLSMRHRLALLEYPLRAMVLASQIRQGLWRRNGMSTQSELHNYALRVTSTYLIDADRTAVQVRARARSVWTRPWRVLLAAVLLRSRECHLLRSS